MGVFRVIDKILLIFLLLIIGPFLLFGMSAILGKAFPLIIGIVVGLIIVAGVIYLLKRYELLEDKKDE